MLVSRALSLLLSLVLPISISLDCLTFDGFTMGTQRLSAWKCALLELAGPCDCALRICVCMCFFPSILSLTLSAASSRFRSHAQPACWSIARGGLFVLFHSFCHPWKEDFKG